MGFAQPRGEGRGTADAPGGVESRSLGPTSRGGERPAPLVARGGRQSEGNVLAGGAGSSTMTEGRTLLHRAGTVLRDVAEAAAAAVDPKEGGVDFGGAEVGPGDGREVVLGVGGLPHEEVGAAMLGAGAD